MTKVLPWKTNFFNRVLKRGGVGGCNFDSRGQISTGLLGLGYEEWGKGH